MRGARCFFSREKQVFLVGFSLTIPRFPRKSKNRLNTSLRTLELMAFCCHNVQVNFPSFFNFNFNNFNLCWYHTIAEANKNQPLITTNMVRILFSFTSCGSRHQSNINLAAIHRHEYITLISK